MNLKKLDKVFSEYIRRRDTDLNGEVKCCTCNTRLHWKKMDAGHWIRRSRSILLRFDERNCHAQCITCNQFKGGNLEEYDRFILNTYGMNVLDELIEASKTETHFFQWEIDELTDKFKAKLKELDN